MVIENIENPDELEQLWKSYIETYDRFFMQLKPYRELLEMHTSALDECGRLLDSGAGSGRVSEKLLKSGKEVVAIDKNWHGLDLLRERAKESGDRLKIKTIDAHILPFESESFDGVNSMLVLPFMKNPQVYLKECARVLRNGGKIVLSGPSEGAKDFNCVGREWINQLKEDGLFEGVQRDWRMVFDNTNVNIKQFVANWFEKDELVNILEDEVGLIVELAKDNPLYGGRGYFIVARKKGCEKTCESINEIEDGVIEEILGDLYKAEHILAKSMECIGDKEYKMTYKFPSYSRTIDSLDHVSMSQIHEAILEGALCSVGQSIKSGMLEIELCFTEFMDRRKDTIYFRENFTFRKILKAGVLYELDFKVIDVKEKRLRKIFYSFVVSVNGFMRGEFEALLEKL